MRFFIAILMVVLLGLTIMALALFIGWRSGDIPL